MARKVVLTSDLSGDTPASTHTFALDGVGYEIDLTDGEAQMLREALLPYFDVARALGGRQAPKASLVGYTAAQVRAWARNNDIDVPDKGRIPNDVVAEFIEQHSV